MAGTATSASYELPSDLAGHRETIRALVRERIAPRAAEIDAAGEYPWDIRELLAAHDLLGLPLPSEHGGAGAGTLALVVAIEEIATACASSAQMLLLQNLGTLAIQLAGTDKQKQSWLPRCASGEWAPAFALTDAHDTTAVRDGEWWVLNGAKRRIANAGVADIYVVFAITDRAQRISTAFVVEADRPGFRAGEPEPTLGMRGVPAGRLALADVRVPDEHRLGEIGEGESIARATLERGRFAVAALAVGIAQGAVDHATAFASERRLRDVGPRLEEMAARTSAARKQLHGACAAGGSVGADVAIDVTVEAIRVLGGDGYLGEEPAGRMLRDAAEALAAAST